MGKSIKVMGKKKNYTIEPKFFESETLGKTTTYSSHL